MCISNQIAVTQHKKKVARSSQWRCPLEKGIERERAQAEAARSQSMQARSLERSSPAFAANRKERGKPSSFVNLNY